MEDKAETVLENQPKALSHFLKVITSSTSPDNIANAFKLFLMYDGKVQKFMNQIIEHQKLAKEIQDLNEQLAVTNGEIKQYVDNLNVIDCSLTNLQRQSMIYRENNIDGDDTAIRKQEFDVDDLLKSAHTLREGTAVKQINLLKNEQIKEQIPIKYPIPQTLTINQSILHCPVDKLRTEFLNKIKDSKAGGDEEDSDDMEDDSDLDEEDESEEGLGALF